ncbi:DUF317 domain-containing protein, partial [Streptomyces prunicolor]|uniref:DUF317 domain-containing protein n=1 Tax=Streptomyces prunicolor TaxID=67348 RepID=UPI0033D09511
MPAAPRDVHVLLDTHPAHPSAVTAHLTGTQHLLAQPLLSDRGFEPLNEHTMVLARIDHDEPYQTNEAVQELTDAGITTEVTPRLREAIHNEWTWDDHPLSWQTDHQLRQLHTEAQQIHDDIRHGHLIVHAHAQDDEGTTMAVATYRVTGKSVHLYGEDHLRGPSGTFDSIADALTAFERAFGDTLRPGPAPMTDTERQTAHARTSLQAPSTPPTATVPVTEEVPAYAADPADHNVLLGSFVSEHGDWERWRTWSDETTHVIHESQTLRIELVHEAHPRDTAWTVAAYETPVSDRMWHLTATAATPAPVLEELLNHLAVGDGWDTNVAATVDEKMVTAATQPLCHQQA